MGWRCIWGRDFVLGFVDYGRDLGFYLKVRCSYWVVWYRRVVGDLIERFWFSCGVEK